MAPFPHCSSTDPHTVPASHVSVFPEQRCPTSWSVAASPPPFTHDPRPPRLNPTTHAARLSGRPSVSQSQPGRYQIHLPSVARPCSLFYTHSFVLSTGSGLASNP